MTRLDDADRGTFLADHPAWELNNETISRTYRLANFSEAMGFVSRVGLAAEVADHHPDIDIRWNRVTLALSTHEENALTEKDTDLAATFDTFTATTD